MVWAALCASLAVVLCLISAPALAQERRDKTMRYDFPAHSHLRYYGYALVGDLDDYREDIKELAKFTNMITMSTPEISATQLETASSEERKLRFAQAREKLQFLDALGLRTCFVNVAGSLMRRKDNREPWFDWLREVRDELGGQLDKAYAFYIIDEPDINGVQSKELKRWIDEFKEFFPAVRCASTYALVSWSEDVKPPDNLEVVAVDPYIGFPVARPAYDFISQYNERFHQAMDFVRQAERSAVMVGDAYVGRNRTENNPMPTDHDTLWFLYLALADKCFEALVWFYYGDHIDDENLDGMRLGMFPETESIHRQIGEALLGWQKPVR